MKKKLKILILNYEYPPLGGGGGVSTKKVAEEFARQGHSVDVLTTWFKGLKKEEIINKVNIHRIKVIGRKKKPNATLSSLISFPFLAYKKAKKLCTEHNYDFINTQFAVPTGPLGIWISKKFKIQNILTIHGGDICDPTKKISPHNYWPTRKVVQWVLNNSHKINAQSLDTIKNTKKYYNPKKRISLIEVPYNPIQFKKTTKANLKLKKDKKYLISIGRLIKRKGFDFLIKSFVKVQDKKIHLLIIGDGPEKENLQRLTKDLNLKNRIHFLGFISNEKKFQYLSCSDIFILSSIHEGLGIVIQEAMQTGLPIIATNKGGQTDIIKDYQNGLLVRYGDEETLAKKIDYLIKDKELKKKMSKINKSKIKKFDVKRITKKYLNLLTK